MVARKNNNGSRGKVRVATGLVFFLATVTVLLYPLMSLRFMAAPSDVIKRFEQYKGPEETQADILLIAGPRIIGELEDYVKNPGKQKRRYAIAAVGRLGGKKAIPLLEAVALSGSEPEYLRKDALLAIFLVDPGYGRVLSIKASIPVTEEDVDMEKELARRSLWELLSTSYSG